jgi:hypothetical protein
MKQARVTFVDAAAISAPPMGGVPKCRTCDSFSEPSPQPLHDRPATICFAYVAGELWTPISQSRHLLSAT